MCLEVRKQELSLTRPGVALVMDMKMMQIFFLFCKNVSLIMNPKFWHYHSVVL